MIRKAILCSVLAGGASAQQWEVGTIGGFGFSGSQTVNRGANSLSTGLSSGATLGAYASNQSRPNLGGEVRYLYRAGGPKLAGTSGMSGRSHLVHYDVLWSPQDRRESQPWFYLAFGGGIRLFESTGIESSLQPARTFALLTQASQVAPMASVGGGMRWALSSRLALRVEARDYLSSFPSKLIAPAPGAKVSGILNDVCVLAGLGVTW